MVEERHSRTEILIGKKAITLLAKKRVAVFGIGGVGGFVCEALARSGIGEIDLIDDDVVSISNINRQLIALHSTVGRSKVEVMEERLKDINPDIRVSSHRCFYTPKTAEQFDFEKYDYVVDAIDTVTGKLELIERAEKKKVPIISAMGAGNKLDPTRFEVSDIFKTSVCPLAKVMRRELKKKGIKRLKVVYSKEEPRMGLVMDGGDSVTESTFRSGNPKKAIPGSISFVPPVVGFIIAGEVIRDLLQNS